LTQHQGNGYQPGVPSSGIHVIHVTDKIKKNPELRKQLEEAKAQNEALAKSGSAQLDWVYRHSDYLEKTVNRYPVGRILN
jgi:hypothetical protein